MISHTYESKRPAKQLVPFLPKQSIPQEKTNLATEARPTFEDKERAKQFKISPELFVARDKIVRQTWVECQYKPGESVRPVIEADYIKYGALWIKGVFKTYHDFPTAEAMDWPEDNRPYILTVAPTKGNEKLILAHPSWVKRLN
jgi:hypothetical protein